jgi:hypothetical protein
MPSCFGSPLTQRGLASDAFSSG